MVSSRIGNMCSIYILYSLVSHHPNIVPCKYILKSLLCTYTANSHVYTSCTMYIYIILPLYIDLPPNNNMFTTKYSKRKFHKTPLSIYYIQTKTLAHWNTHIIKQCSHTYHKFTQSLFTSPALKYIYLII